MNKYIILREAIEDAETVGEHELASELEAMLSKDTAYGEEMMQFLASFWCDVDEFRITLLDYAKQLEEYGFRDEAFSISQFNIYGGGIKGMLDLQERVESLKREVSDKYGV